MDLSQQAVGHLPSKCLVMNITNMKAHFRINSSSTKPMEVIKPMVKCLKCGQEIKESVNYCPNCGQVRKPTTPISAKVGLIVVVSVIILTTVIGISQSDSSSSGISQPTNPQVNSTSSSSTESNWWSGGTLHGATGYEWRSATYANKLATCGDILMYLWQENKLSTRISRNISGIMDLRVYADSLVTALDIVYEIVPGDEETDSFVASQEVSEMVVLNLAITGWIQ